MVIIRINTNSSIPIQISNSFLLSISQRSSKFVWFNGTGKVRFRRSRESNNLKTRWKGETKGTFLPKSGVVANCHVRSSAWPCWLLARDVFFFRFLSISYSVSVSLSYFHYLSLSFRKRSNVNKNSRYAT